MKTLTRSLALVVFLVSFKVTLACSGTITPADRGAAYAAFAKDHKFKCAAYGFDVSSGLSPVVPEMAESCD